MKTIFLKKNARPSGKNGIFVICVFLASVTTAACGSDQQQSKQSADFLPIRISIGCKDDTPISDRLNIERAAGVNQAIMPVECVDRKKSVSGIYPEQIGVVHRKSIDVWNLVLILSKNDAANVDALSKDNVGKAVLVSVGSKVVAKAILNGPIVGQRVYISVDSEKDGEVMAGRFMAPSSEKNERVKS